MNGVLFSRCGLALAAGLLPVAVLAQANFATPYVITTLAGSSSGSLDGTGSAAGFDQPSGIAVDRSGNLFVADSGNNTIREITPAGVVTTVAGLAGSYGSADGVGSLARFNGPSAVAVDGVGNVYIADSYNYTVRMASPTVVNGGTTWAVTTIAGAPDQWGSADGVGSAARFGIDGPKGLAIDGAGNLYVTDAYLEAVRMIVPTAVNGTTIWTVSTIAGGRGQSGSADGPGAAAEFNGPTGSAVDGAGNVYIADTGNINTIRMISPTVANGATTWEVATVVGMPGGTGGTQDGTGSAVRFEYPEGVAVDGAGNIFVADTRNDSIRLISPTVASGSTLWTVTTLAGGNGPLQSGHVDGTGSAARFNHPTSVAVDGAGNVYVADTYNNVIRKGVPAVAPSITVAPKDQSVVPGGAATFTITVSSTPPPTFQWWVLVGGRGNWTALTDGNGVSGSATANLTVAYAANQLNGNQYECVITNPAGSVTTAPVTLDAATQTNYATPYLITTVAGSPFGSVDGTGSGAQFNSPYALAVDKSGNVIVADTNSFTIRKVTPGGVVTTLAGKTGEFGNTDGLGTNAQFYNPKGTVVDGAGTIYVADSQNSTIRKITSAGFVSTFAGSPGQFSSLDGTGSAARFDGPTGIALDSSGNLYVADYGNCTIRKITSGGVVTTLAGMPGQFGAADGAGSAARFNSAVALTVDGAGNVYVADASADTLRKVTPAGVVTTLAGKSGQAGSADGAGTAAQFNKPSGVAVDSGGNVYVADTGNFEIRKVTAAGVVSTLAGSTTATVKGVDGTGSSATFSNPEGVAVDSSGIVYVADAEAIRKIMPAAVVTTLAGRENLGTGISGTEYDGVGRAAVFNGPGGLAFDGAGNLLVVDGTGDSIRKMTPLLLVTTLASFGSPLFSPGDMTAAATTTSSTTGITRVVPNAIAVSNGGTINVTVSDDAIDTVTSQGVIGVLAGGAAGQGGSSTNDNLNGVAIDSSGNVYVADTDNDTIRRITPTGAVTTFAGLASQEGSADGAGSAARFSAPYGLAFDSAGTLYVADSGNGTIRKITPGGVVTTLAGNATQAGSADGQGLAAQFDFPTALTIDGQGNVYVVDAEGGTVRKVTPSGAVTTLAGAVGLWGTEDGQGSSVRFNSLGGIAVDKAGYLYVSDSGSNTIRMGVPAAPPAITSQPMDATVTSGSSAVLTVGSVAGATYQWQYQGANLSNGSDGIATFTGATGPQLLITGATPAEAGSYACVVSLPSGSATTNTAQLSVASGSAPGAVSSISSRAFVGTGDNVLIGGFYISGSTSATVLVQAIGPALAPSPYSVSGTLQHPALTIHQNQNGKDVVLYSNIGWGSSPVLLAAAAAAYAQPVLQPGSPDSELLVTLPPGGYTAEVTGSDGGTGVALCAIYQLP